MFKYGIITWLRKEPCRYRSSALVICGIISWITLYLIYDHLNPKYLLNLAKYKLKSVYSTESDYTLLININFTFKSLPLVCSENEDSLLILVHSTTDNFNNRKVIRETWGQYDNSTKTLFLIGSTENAETQKKIDEESKLNKDIIQGSFLDSYHNLTYKHVMALKYVVYHCPKAKFVLKVDDDVFVNIPAWKLLITSYECQKKQPKRILCSRSFYPPVLRVGKWAVSLEDYPEAKYPIYCGGFAILYPLDVVYALYTAAQKTKYFWVDDVFVTGICAKISNISHIGINKLILLKNKINHVIQMLSENIDKPFLVAAMNLNENHIRSLWQVAKYYKPRTILDYLNSDEWS